MVMTRSGMAKQLEGGRGRKPRATSRPTRKGYLRKKPAKASKVKVR
jgi:hypothetical protein